jgi:hypothetical protein
VNPRVVEMLNDALTLELTVTNSYFLNARMLDNWGLHRLGKVFYDLSIDEMRDADDLINRILLFDGHPNVQRLNPSPESSTPSLSSTRRLRSATASETTARLPSSRRWSVTRRSTSTGSRHSSTSSRGWERPSTSPSRSTPPSPPSPSTR